MAVSMAGPGAPALRVVRPGLMTTIQDLGRPGLASFGVSPSGALDPVAHALANALVGNPTHAAALEITGPGVELEFLRAQVFAIAGADLSATLSGVPLPPRFVGQAEPGARLAFTVRRAGARVAVALAGGISAPRVLGSVAIDLSAGLGGGRLRAGQTLLLEALPASRTPPMLPPQLLQPFADLFAAQPGALRYVPDPAGGVPAVVHALLQRRTFRVDGRSNRAGFRFDGQPLPMQADPDRLSEPTAPGAIQLPPDGLPILLLAERNTTGGYPRIGHLVSADRTRAAQLWPGDPVRFVAISLADATAATRAVQAAITRALAEIAGCA
jgi:biotin-dependent carboxylase-like uncharacterized protein